MINPIRITLMLSILLVIPCLASGAADYRLPPEIEPLSQNIELRLDPALTTYTGHTSIELNVTSETGWIGINQVGLAIEDIVLSSEYGDRTLELTESEWERVWLSDGEPINAGKYTLTMRFQGSFSTDSLGMHRVTFEGRDYIFTQMESMYARRAFPVFDEPSFKIPYQLTIHAPSAHTVLTNTPPNEVSEADGWKTTQFMQTPPLSSYLLAIAVGPLDRAEIKGMSVPGFVYTPSGHADQVGFVVREIPTIVAWLEDYFGKAYPYRKLDMVAVPEFAFGAMENPGLIKYRTDLLMVGDEVSGRAAVGVLGVIAHEVAHIWYGDLVTMEWWDDLWLNEAFASWMAALLMEQAYPQYETNLNLPQDGAFAADQQTTSRAIRRTVRNSDEIFDGLGLNYSKGSALLNMLENYVGPDAWREGIRQYVDKFAWSNATEPDLWAVISQTSGKDVSAIAGGYLNQPGFALIDVQKDGFVEQTRYLAAGREAPDLEWSIPVNIKYKADGEIQSSFSLLTEKTGTLEIAANADWMFPDAGGNGYYRWKTSPDQFANLVDDVDQLTERERIALISNSGALLTADNIALEDYMSVLSKLAHDPHPLVFRPTVEAIKNAGETYVDPGSSELFSAFVDQTLAGRFAEVGVVTRPGDSEALQQMRPRLVRVLGQFGSDQAVRTAAAELTDQYLASPDSVQSGLALEAMRVNALTGGSELYERYITTYLESESPTQKSNILASVYFLEPDVIQRHLEFSLTDDVPAGDTLRALSGYAYLLDDHTVLLQWLEKNMESLKAKIPAYLNAYLPQYLGGNCNPDDLASLNEFFSNRGEEYARSLAKATESAETCIDQRVRYSKDMRQYLQQVTAAASG